MDSTRQFLPSPFLGFPIIATILYFLMRRPRCREAPQAPGAWPILGHLRLLSGRELPHKTLAAVADKCGPIFTLRIGLHRAVVVSSWEVAKECYTTNDRAFASRPAMTAAQILGYNYVMFPFSPYGPYWRELRKISTSELLSSRKLELLGDIRESEIATAIKELYEMSVKLQSKENNDGLVEMKQWFGDLTLNLILRMTVGKRYGSNDSESRRCQKSARNFMRLWGLFNVGDALPCLEWLDLQGYKKDMKRTIKELDSSAQTWLDEHKEGEANGERERDFMDAMISILEDSTISNCNNDTVTKATCLSIIIGGSDTMMLTLTWILSLLLNNTAAMRKAQDELDRHVGKDRKVNEPDIKNLVYLGAIIKEAFRLYPASPLSGPRVAIQDCVLAGYHIAAGTRLLVNVWKIHRDPLVWSDPSEFQPERFLTQHVDTDIKGQHYELLPFGGGRRSCPGISFALQVLPLVMARLLHGFELRTQTDSPVDMTESAGLTSFKATPLEVVIKPRLSPELYGL